MNISGVISFYSAKTCYLLITIIFTVRMVSSLCPGEYSAPSVETAVPGPKSHKLLSELKEFSVRQ